MFYFTLLPATYESAQFTTSSVTLNICISHVCLEKERERDTRRRRRERKGEIYKELAYVIMEALIFRDLPLAN